jgi:hypothetical protein
MGHIDPHHHRLLLGEPFHCLVIELRLPVRPLHPNKLTYETHQVIHAPKLGIDLQRDVGEILILSSFIECLIQLHAHRRYTKLDISNALIKIKTVKCRSLQDVDESPSGLGK